MSGLLGHRGLLLKADVAPGWDPAFLDSLVALSNNNLTATKTSGGHATGATRSVQSRSSGKWYFEVSKDNIIGPGVGVCTGSMSTASNVGDTSASWGLITGWGGKYHAASSNSYGSGFSAGDIVMVAVDLDNGRIWWGKNGSWFASGDPAAGTNAAYSNLSGAIYAAVSPGPTPGSATAQFAAPFAHTPPAGFSAWGG